MKELRAFLSAEASMGKTIFPRGNDIFNAFNHTPLSKVKVVVLGQDPYHGPGQAHGLSFSVREGVRPPPSLLNIFKEIRDDLGIPLPAKGDLTKWADQGVLLLNAVLTVENGLAASHRNRGWERFTDRVIEILSCRDNPIIFLLWGRFAHDKAPMIRVPPHKVLKAPHPSPLSAYSGFFGSKHFSKTNELLKAIGREPIDWSL
jgi:uracil-DNA glycosylase